MSNDSNFSNGPSEAYTVKETNVRDFEWNNAPVAISFEWVVFLYI